MKICLHFSSPVNHAREIDSRNPFGDFAEKRPSLALGAWPGFLDGSGPVLIYKLSEQKILDLQVQDPGQVS